MCAKSGGVVVRGAAFQAERGTSLARAWYARSPFDALASLACSGQVLRALAKTRAFEMTQVAAH